MYCIVDMGTAPSVVKHASSFVHVTHMKRLWTLVEVLLESTQQ